VIANVIEVDGVAVAELPVDVDSANAVRLREQLSAAVPHGSRDLVVDLTPTRYVDSAGIEMLFRIAQRLSERRAVLRVVIPATSNLVRLAAIAGLERAMTIYEDRGGAVAAARAEQPPCREADEAPAGNGH
jgi:anti-anti-sigma factor